MHPPEVKAKALELVTRGINDCEISRRLGIPRRTILDWRRPTYQPRSYFAMEDCHRCWRSTRPIRLTSEDYAELLAMYLGDGCISEQGRAQRLRLFLDARYPNLNAEAAALLRRCFPRNRVAFTKPGRSSLSGRSDTWTVLSVHSQHLSCVFPQHGKGKKHERSIVLERWQDQIVETEPWSFIRGLIRTDGCAFINRTDVHRPTPYEYLSYGFSNLSSDIVQLFIDACDRVGVFTRVNRNSRGRWDVRINRRDSVGLMLEHVGLKS